MAALDVYVTRRLPIAAELTVLFKRSAQIVIVEVGACEGEDTIRYQRRFPRAAIHAFEPLPKNVERARHNFAVYGLTKVQLEPVAVADEEGEATLHVSSGPPPRGGEMEIGNRSSSLLAPSAAIAGEFPWLAFNETLTVPVTTLAHYAAAHAFEKVDLLHLDVQGAELRVLEGAGPLLSRIRAIWLEAEAIPLYEGQPLAGEVERFLERHGFLKIVDTVGRVSGDQLYVQPALVSHWRIVALRALQRLPGRRG